ncbi:MAG: hypothetical protein ACRDUV_02245, partial [Pseudonocardiaceae bacterium]
KGDRKLEVMRPNLDRLIHQGRTGVAAIGVAQEFQRVFTGTTYHSGEGGEGVPRFGYAKADRRITAYYFSLVDEVSGPAFIKVCAYSLIRSRSGLTVTSSAPLVRADLPAHQRARPSAAPAVGYRRAR